MKYSVVSSIHHYDLRNRHRVSYIRRSLKQPRIAGIIWAHAWSPVYGWHEYSLNIWVRTHKGITFKVCI